MAQDKGGEGQREGRGERNKARAREGWREGQGQRRKDRDGDEMKTGENQGERRSHGPCARQPQCDQDQRKILATAALPVLWVS